MIVFIRKKNSCGTCKSGVVGCQHMNFMDGDNKRMVGILFFVTRIIDMAEAAPIPIFKSLADAFPDAEIRIKQRWCRP